MGHFFLVSGELLLDQGRFEDAIEKFDQAISIEKSLSSSSTSPSSSPQPTNVLSLVNKSLAIYQHTQNLSLATELCLSALSIDPECEAAVATLAQLNLQQSKVGEAVKMFERQVELARSEPEVVNALTYLYVSVLKTLGEREREREVDTD